MSTGAGYYSWNLDNGPSSTGTYSDGNWLDAALHPAETTVDVAAAYVDHVTWYYANYHYTGGFGAPKVMVIDWPNTSDDGFMYCWPGVYGPQYALFDQTVASSWSTQPASIVYAASESGASAPVFPDVNAIIAAGGPYPPTPDVTGSATLTIPVKANTAGKITLVAQQFFYLEGIYQPTSSHPLPWVALCYRLYYTGGQPPVYSTQLGAYEYPVMSFAVGFEWVASCKTCEQIAVDLTPAANGNFTTECALFEAYVGTRPMPNANNALMFGHSQTGNGEPLSQKPPYSGDFQLHSFTIPSGGEDVTVSAIGDFPPVFYTASGVQHEEIFIPNYIWGANTPQIVHVTNCSGGGGGPGGGGGDGSKIPGGIAMDSKRGWLHVATAKAVKTFHAIDGSAAFSGSDLAIDQITQLSWHSRQAAIYILGASGANQSLNVSWDGGKTMKEVASVAASNSVISIDSKRNWIVWLLEDSDHNVTCAVSRDGGASFDSPFTPQYDGGDLSASLIGAGFDERRAAIDLVCSISDANTIIESKDAGKTWGLVAADA